MDSTEAARAERRRRQAGKTVLVALIIAFSGAMQGVVFGILLGDMTTPEIWNIALCAAVTGGLACLLWVRPGMATGVITGLLSVFFVFYLNTGAILAYRASGEIVTIVPFVVWFFPLVLFHQFTNFGFYKRSIGLMVSLSPLPIMAYVLLHLPGALGFEDLGRIMSFMISFLAFVCFFGYFTQQRDEEILRAAKAEETERSAIALRVSDERFKLLSRATNDLIWDVDLTSGRMWWNDALLDTYGYDPATEGRGINAWESWVHPEDRDRVVSSLRTVIDAGESRWGSEYRFQCANGRTLDVVARGLVLRDEAGVPVRVVGSTTDVTELMALQKKLRQSQKMEAVGQLTGGIAHDFNNLLTIIVGNSEALSNRLASDPDAQRLAETTMQAAERGAALTSRLLSFARLQALTPKHLHPQALLTGIQELIRRTIDERIEIQIKVAADVSPIEVDPGQLENAILNLVLNARDAMPDGGRLRIEASNVTLAGDSYLPGSTVREGEYVMIAVSDTGRGMSPDVSERAFEPFFTTKEMGKGSGLGLSMVWGFVQQSMGHARIYSEPGEGTVVKLYFPAAVAQRVPEEKARIAVGPAGGTERILVVEDDELVRKHVLIQLGSLGYECREATSGAEALAIMDDGWTFDLLFTDMVMPGGMNGRQLSDAAQLRQPHLKVLFTSGYTEDTIIHHGRLDPGVHLLSKPYRRAELASKIRRLLDD